MAINTDTATQNGKNAFALVARDEHGIIACMAAKFTANLEADMAKLSAMEWAVDIVDKLGWPKVMWWSDAKLIVDQIISMKNLRLWRQRHQILTLKQKFNQKDWKLEWCPREVNILAEQIAKRSFTSELDMFFDKNAFFGDPPTCCPGIYGEAPFLFSFL